MNYCCTLCQKVFCLIVAGSGLLVSDLSAEIRLPKIFSDHMVLQREKKIPLWGWSPAGKQVTIKFADQVLSVTSNARGKWEAALEPMEAGGPFVLEVGTDHETVQFNDVLVGDVWVCSGQSNMTVPVREAKDGAKEAARANHPQVRLFHLGYNLKHLANQPKEDFEGEGYGWKVCEPDIAQHFSAVAYFFGRELQKAVNVPIGLIHSSWGATGIYTWCPREVIQADAQARKTLEPWDAAWNDFRTGKTTKDPNQCNNDSEFCTVSNQPCGLFNGTIAPVIPYGIKGVIWYQGESNTPEASYYAKIFPAMIQGWRKAWGQGSFPFLYVQLANYDKRLPDPSESDWAELRESQMLSLRVPNTAMVTAIDIGEEANIHPANKQEVGRRLSLAARATVYGQKVVYRGPVYYAMRLENGKIRLRFKETGGGLSIHGSELKGFAIAGADKKFVWARAKIEGNSVIVWNENVPKPIVVRYAWAKNPEGNLYNKEGLPAFPFRTDKRFESSGH